MSMLRIYPEANAAQAQTFTDYDIIASQLHGIGVRFERWAARQPLSAASSDADILAAYRSQVDRLMKEYDFKSCDVVSLSPDHPNKVELRKKFLDEHIHTDFEVRFFVDGKGLFFLHAQKKVYAVMCEQGDLLSLPANTKHWFDMGANPNLKCIRLFTTPEGWVAEYTGDAIAKQFPNYDTF